jgi:hypothetical protein
LSALSNVEGRGQLQFEKRQTQVRFLARLGMTK